MKISPQPSKKGWPNGKANHSTCRGSARSPVAQAMVFRPRSPMRQKTGSNSARYHSRKAATVNSQGREPAQAPICARSGGNRHDVRSWTRRRHDLSRWRRTDALFKNPHSIRAGKAKQIRAVLCTKCFNMRAGRAGTEDDDTIDPDGDPNARHVYAAGAALPASLTANRRVPPKFTRRGGPTAFCLTAHRLLLLAAMIGHNSPNYVTPQTPPDHDSPTSITMALDNILTYDRAH
jgi:hypothetical protein